MPKLGRDYSMYNKEGRPTGSIERAQHTHQEDTIGFFDMLNGKHIEAHLTTGEQIDGILETNAYNRYDVLIRNDEGLYVVRKDVLRFVKLYLNKEGEKKK